MKILIVIPARGGSKGIPRKNIRLLNGKPLLYYSIKNAKNVIGDEKDIVVDTDDDEIANIAYNYGINVVKRPKELADDSTTLDPVIHHAIVEMEKRYQKTYDIVITMQATSPTLKNSTLNKAINEFIDKRFDTMISAVNCVHLSWRKINNHIVPNYQERVNRQQLPDNYVESGAFVISKREVCTEKTRIGKNVGIYTLNDSEGIDIDNDLDWILCEHILKRKRIVIRADGEKTIGMGHIYRSITIAFMLIGHDITIVTNKNCTLGIEKIESVFLPMKKIANNQEFFRYLEDTKPDIVINDILNTDIAYMQKVKENAKRVINFEDIGEGAKYADAVINALYERDNVGNTFNGFEFYCIREEFFEAKINEFHPQVKNMLIIFGGSDPSNLTARLYNVCQKLHRTFKDVQFHIVTGLGYKYKLQDDKKSNIFVHRDVMRVSKYMQHADLAITSQGRTIYELAYMGIPSIVLAQNKREQEHSFASLKNGFINLGMGKLQNESTIYNTISWLMNTPQVRQEMREALLEKDFSKGRKRVKNIILDE